MRLLERDSCLGNLWKNSKRVSDIVQVSCWRVVRRSIVQKSYSLSINTKLKQLLTQPLRRLQQYSVRFHLDTNMTPRPTQLAASLKVWNLHDCHPWQAILDSGSSGYFMPMSYKGNHKKHTSRGITVACVNGGQLVSTATDILLTSKEFQQRLRNITSFPIISL